MASSDTAWLFAAQDNSDGEVLTEKLAVRFRTVEEATEFKTNFEAAQLFNKKAAAGDTDLVMAPEVEDEKEELDNPDENVSAEEAKA